MCMKDKNFEKKNLRSVTNLITTHRLSSFLILIETYLLMRIQEPEGSLIIFYNISETILR